MFYCESCASKEGWPASSVLSHGACEICEVVGKCYDMPSKHLGPLTCALEARVCDGPYRLVGLFANMPDNGILRGLVGGNKFPDNADDRTREAFEPWDARGHKVKKLPEEEVGAFAGGFFEEVFGDYSGLRECALHGAILNCESRGLRTRVVYWFEAE